MGASATLQQSWAMTVMRTFAQDLDPRPVHADIAYFKIGEGGFHGEPGEPDTPLTTRVDLVSEGTAIGGLAITGGFENGSTTVVGTSTTFLTSLQVGDWIKPGASTTGATIGSSGIPGTEYDAWGQVQSITSNTSLELADPYAGATTTETRTIRKAPAPYYTFRKNLEEDEVVQLTTLPAVLEIVATVNTDEANQTQLLDEPSFFELAVFDSNGVMVSYMTFDREQKTEDFQLTHILHLLMAPG